jgi:predicted DNA-binding protein with PD1-like motif
MTGSRHLRHPGPALDARVEVVSGRGYVLTLALEAGLTLHEAIARPLLARGIESAALAFGAMRLDPLVYYLPSVVEGPYLRFWYSEGQKPEGGGRVEMAHASFGRRDGAPFVHCHGIWLEADGQWHGGHVVPTESVLAAPVEVRVAVLPDAALLSEHDAETEYQLFHPVPVASGSAPEDGPRMTFARVKPNQDLTEAVEAVCRQAGYASASVHGLGSLIGARFTDGTVLEDQGSEILLMGGRVRSGAGGMPRAELDICFSGFSGLASRGRLLPGENPVCITFELLIEEGSASGPQG